MSERLDLVFVAVSRRCSFCKGLSEILVPQADYDRWKGGELVQDVWPDMTPDERELLISGTHPKCWEDAFGTEDCIDTNQNL